MFSIWYRAPPLPPVYWNLWVSGKLVSNLWGSISYGQNLEPQRLNCVWPLLIFISHGVAVAQNDRTFGMGARSDVTRSASSLWKFNNSSATDLHGSTRI